MRSILALAALAAVDFVAGSACKPKSSNTIPTLVSSSTDATISSTATSVVTLPKVRNLAANGNMAEVDPNNPLSVPGWEVDGDARIVGGAGREEPGSTERGCAAMSASNNGDGKRALGISVSISQSMSNLDLSTPYTIRFYYLVVTSPAAINLCQLTGFLGGSVFYQNWVFSTGTAVSWNEVLQAVTPAQVNAPLRIAMNCLIGGGATVLVDSVFISNAVTPQNINDFAVNFGNTGTGANPPLDPPVVVSEAQSSTVPVVGTTSTAPEQPFCSKALNGGCWWKRPDNGNDMVNCASRGSWPGSTGQGHLVPRPDNYPLPLSQLWCLGWCSLSPGCKSVAFVPEDRSCRFSEHQVQDADFVPGPDPNLDTEGVFYWHDLSCFNCPCNDETSPTSVASTTQSAEPTDLVKLPAASTCPKSLENGCQWNERSQGGSLTSCQYRGRWPGSDGAGFAVEQPRDYPTAWSQMWCVAWCSLYPGCKSAAWMPSDRSCRFSTHQVSDADFVMAADPNSDSVEDGIYYWHDLDCMTCPCHDDPTSETISSLPADSTTLTRAVTPKPNTPTTVTATTKAVTGTPTPGPVEQPCDWSFGQGICQRPFEKEQGPCAGKLMIVNPSQYTKLPLNWKPEITEPVQCAIMCHTNPDCYAWGFEWSSNMNCVLSLGQTEVDQLEVVSSGAQYRWYSHTCWECRDCVTQWNWSWDSLPAGN
ncbi:hypothetical protein FOC1_g10008840 [Fusarium oxysporum f. sp. cubense race 1]|uniref:Apple domain-containing protein n=1 Tax=Fusarium oxysporum f. sp. cubense (strain race 1) TaxID=1229664 RepID=N4UT94_FUSC1|nr:hypothetical protein FOC1_g10008840 [Fusarium oxysporum f. sp. cubense race 1]